MEFVYNGNSRKSGVYKIINIQNGRIYIGSAKEFKARARQHLWSLKNNKHHNKFLQNDFNKCNENAFEFHVVLVTKGTTEERRKVEQNFINEQIVDWKNCYNFQKKVADEQSLWSHNPEETKKKKSEHSKLMWQSPEFRENMSRKMKLIWQNPKHRENISQKNSVSVKELWQDPKYRRKLVKKARERFINKKDHPMFGKKHSEESKQKMSEAHKGKKQTEETKQKKSKALKGRKISEEQKQRISQLNSKLYDIKLISLDGEIFGPIQNLTKFCRVHNLNRRHVITLINKKRKSHKGWKLLK